IMTKRSMRYRGFGLTVELPDRIGRSVARLLPRTKSASEPAPVEKLAFNDAPPVAIDLREAERASANEFVTKVAPQFAADAAGKDEIAAHPWYHTIEFPDGTVTPGRFDHRPLVSRYGLPSDLSGKRALDVGSGDGFWAFTLERLGADVTSVDI